MLDAGALQKLVRERPEDVEAIAKEVTDLLGGTDILGPDSVLLQSLDIMSFCRRLHMVALAAIDRRLKAARISDPEIGFQVLRVAHKAFTESGLFTIKDLEAAATKNIITDYFDLLAATSMFQIAAPQELEEAWEKLQKAAAEQNRPLITETSNSPLKSRQPNRLGRRAKASNLRKSSSKSKPPKKSAAKVPPPPSSPNP